MSRVELVPFVRSHFAELASWFPTEADAIQWGGPKIRFPVDDTQLAAMLRNGEGADPARICRSALVGGNIVGHAQAALDRRDGIARLARVAIAPPRRGARLADQMLRLLLGELFGDDAFDRVELNVYADNAPAIALYRRLGFKEEGIRRSSVRVGAQRWDTMIMGMFRDEWRG